MGRKSTFGFFWVFFLTIVISTQMSSGFKVYWNIPSELCQKRYNISFAYVSSDYGITMNTDDMFRGKEVTILYKPGLFPEIKGYKYNPFLKNTFPDISSVELINGGLPQSGNMWNHLSSFELFVNLAVPDPKNEGLIIIDMEHFGATWAQNFNEMEIYNLMSIRKVAENYPTANTIEIETKARLEYERAAIRFLVNTIQYGKALRPYARWGYYQYPQCFNLVGTDFCSNTTQIDNNNLIMLWKNSDVLFPSTYLINEGTAEEKAMRTKGRVREAQRALRLANNQALVIPYITYKYYFEPVFILDEDLKNLIAVPKEEGADGVVIWGSSDDFDSREKCLLFNQFVRNSVGPIAQRYITENNINQEYNTSPIY